MRPSRLGLRAVRKGGPPARRRRRHAWLLSGAALLASTALLLLTEGSSFLPLAPRPVPAGPVAAANPASAPGGLANLPGSAGLRSLRPAGDTIPLEVTAPSVPPEELQGYAWPLRKARVMTWYGPTDDGFVVVDGQRIHDGLDLATFCGDTVRAAHDGTVVYVGRSFDPYLGYDEPPASFYATLRIKGLPETVLPIVVVVDDGNGYRSIYVHLESTSVGRGAAVRAGQALGREGMTGHATGCHLHYGLIRLDGPFVPVAPDLVARWHYPAWVRTRVDPLLVLDPFAPGAARQVPGLPPPVVSPGGPSRAALLAMWRARQPLPVVAPAAMRPG